MKWTCWIAAAILCYGTVSADAGLFGLFGKKGGGFCHKNDCCPEECCEQPSCCAPEECCEQPSCCAPEECCEEDCCEDCASTGCCLKKRGGLLSKLFGCLKKKRHHGCCEEGCCEEECCPTCAAPACCAPACGVPAGQCAH